METIVKYHVCKDGMNFSYRGFVDVMDGETLVFHQMLTTRPYSEVMELSNDDIDALAQSEAEVILASDEAKRIVAEYVDIKEKGRYVMNMEG